MAGPRFEIGERVWHPANKDNGVSEGFGIVMTRQAKSTHTAHQSGFLYRLKSDEDMNAINFNFDENDLKTAEEGEEAEEAAIKKREEERKARNDAAKKVQSQGLPDGSGKTNTVTLTPQGNPPANPNLSGGPISTTGLVTHETTKPNLPPGTPGVPVPTNVPHKTDDEKKKEAEAAKKEADAAKGTGTNPVPSGIPPKVTGT